MTFIIDIKCVGLASNRLSKHLLPDLPDASLCRDLAMFCPKIR